MHPCMGSSLALGRVELSSHKGMFEMIEITPEKLRTMTPSAGAATLIPTLYPKMLQNPKLFQH